MCMAMSGNIKCIIFAVTGLSLQRSHQLEATNSSKLEVSPLRLVPLVCTASVNISYANFYFRDNCVVTPRITVYNDNVKMSKMTDS